MEFVTKKACKIVTNFKHSEQACRHLEEHQLSMKDPVHSLLQDVETKQESYDKDGFDVTQQSTLEQVHVKPINECLVNV